MILIFLKKLNSLKMKFSNLILIRLEIMDFESRHLYPEEKVDTTENQIMQVFITKWFNLLKSVKQNSIQYIPLKKEYNFLMNYFNDNSNDNNNDNGVYRPTVSDEFDALLDYFNSNDDNGVYRPTVSDELDTLLNK
jgi:hypothetical protein